MTPVQEIVVRMQNGDAAFVLICSMLGGFKAQIDYRVASGPAFDPTDGPIMGSAEAAFDWMIGVVQGVAAVRSSVAEVVENPCNTEFLPAASQRAILQGRNIDVFITVNGVEAI